MSSSGKPSSVASSASNTATTGWPLIDASARCRSRVPETVREAIPSACRFAVTSLTSGSRVTRSTERVGPDMITLIIGSFARVLRPQRIGAGSSTRDKMDVAVLEDRKSTRLNSSHEWISYAVFCLKKKKKKSDVEFGLIENNMYLEGGR